MVDSKAILAQMQLAAQSDRDSPEGKLLSELFVQSIASQSANLLTEHSKMKEAFNELAKVIGDTTTSVEAKYYEIRGILRGGM